MYRVINDKEEEASVEGEKRDNPTFLTSVFPSSLEVFRLLGDMFIKSKILVLWKTKAEPLPNIEFKAERNISFFGNSDKRFEIQLKRIYFADFVLLLHSYWQVLINQFNFGSK